MADNLAAKENRDMELNRQKSRGAPGPIGNLIGGGEKARNGKRTLARLLNFLKPQMTFLLISFALTVVCTIASSKAPDLLANLVDIITNGAKSGLMDFKEIQSIVILTLGLYLFSSAATLIQQYMMIHIAQNIVCDMRSQMECKLRKLPIRFFDTHSRGDVLSRVANDAENISMSLQMSLTQIISAVITIVAVLYFMLRRSIVLTTISLVTVALCFLLTKVIASKSRKYFTAQWNSTGKLNGQIEEMFTGHSVVKLFGREKAAMEQFQEENEKLCKSSFFAAMISGIIQPAMTVINNLNYVAVCVLGGIWVINGGPFGTTITLGDITAIVTYSKLLMQPITATASIASTIQSLLASAERVFDLLDEKEESLDGETAEPFLDPKVITFSHVSFRYKAEQPLIEDLNLTVRPGEKVAIVGPTGAGKTTLVNLLMRFYEVDEGEITIDGRDIRTIPRDHLRSKIGMVLQDVWLFGGTIRESIAYGFHRVNETEASQEQIMEASKMAGVDHFVQTLQNGYETVLSDDAEGISQGQKQLITIARAFLSEPSVLILDEATSSVDTRTEVLIQKAMRRLMEGRTSFVIAHRLSTIRDADMILVMNEGQIIETGNHQELLDKKGFYYDLYQSQFAGTSL